eukprot:TRINITY_DN5917_c0_g2_i3.p2 TRINITY_DN5917_c0_g2~~TRINITY_DN5917_c0_g2_i3.p2  ORF type:complete len:207 (+),score=26.01 TRINITY_DN5917_c0_g2_i3:145-765(+)
MFFSEFQFTPQALLSLQEAFEEVQEEEKLKQDQDNLNANQLQHDKDYLTDLLEEFFIQTESNNKGCGLEQLQHQLQYTLQVAVEDQALEQLQQEVTMAQEKVEQLRQEIPGTVITSLEANMKQARPGEIVHQDEMQVNYNYEPNQMDDRIAQLSEVIRHRYEEAKSKCALLRKTYEQKQQQLQEIPKNLFDLQQLTPLTQDSLRKE